MGAGSFSFWQLLVILLLALLFFGAKRLRGMGSDLGGAVRDFKKALDEDNTKTVEPTSLPEQPVDKKTDQQTHKTEQ
jgi:sec-independent protein translocase protein TatA